MPIRPPLPIRRGAPWLAALALLAALASPARAQNSAPAPGTDPDAVLATLRDLKAKQSQVINREKQGVMAAIAVARADPAKAFDQAMAAVEFQGQGNDGTRIVEWRKKQGEMLRNPAFVNGLRLQLAYITLTWQRSMGAKNKDLLPALYDYTAQVIGNLDTMWGFDPLRKSLGDTVFARYFQIGPFLGAIDNWSDQPIDVDSIYQKAILPTLRDMKDPRVLDYWVAKIGSEAAQAGKSSNNLSINKFNTVRRPELLWNRAEDEEIIGQHDQAVADMLALVKAHPDHPNFDKWVARLTELVKPVHAEVIVRDVPDQTAPAPVPSGNR